MDKTIRIKQEVKENLDQIGNKSDSYSMVVEKLLKGYKGKKNHFLTARKKLDELFIFCQICDKYKATEVHHRNIDRANNHFSNLNFVCRKCHMDIHHPQRVVNKKNLNTNIWNVRIRI